MTKNSIVKIFILSLFISGVLYSQSQSDFLGYWIGEEDLESESITYESRNISLDITEGGVREGFYIYNSSCDFLYNSDLNWAYHYIAYDKENNTLTFLRRFITPVGILGYEELIYNILEWSEDYFLVAYTSENREVSHYIRLDVQLLDVLSLKPRNVNLRKNYPNPFNPKTTFDVYLGDISKVELLIYDKMGREITVLHKGLLKGGINKFSWDGSDANGKKVASGTYLCVLNINDQFSQTQKISYIK